jgi:hypothetical protein
MFWMYLFWSSVMATLFSVILVLSSNAVLSVDFSFRGVSNSWIKGGSLWGLLWSVSWGKPDSGNSFSLGCWGFGAGGNAGGILGALLSRCFYSAAFYLASALSAAFYFSSLFSLEFYLLELLLLVKGYLPYSLPSVIAKILGFLWAESLLFFFSSNLFLSSRYFYLSYLTTFIWVSSSLDGLGSFLLYEVSLWMAFL